tara:strand:+ start:1552 stop:1986 length:435 start_codon:yes stop_codon:yes gene_type:complete
MDRETLKKKSYKDLRLFISKTNITGYTKLTKTEMIDLILLQHPYRFTKCMEAVQPSYVLDLIINNNYEDPADEFSSPVIQPKNSVENGEIKTEKKEKEEKEEKEENIKITFPLNKFGYSLFDRPLTEKEIIEKEKLKQGILTFN